MEFARCYRCCEDMRKYNTHELDLLTSKETKIHLVALGPNFSL